MEQTRGLFCIWDSGVARCQSQHQCHFWRMNSMLEAYCTSNLACRLSIKFMSFMRLWAVAKIYRFIKGLLWKWKSCADEYRVDPYLASSGTSWSRPIYIFYKPLAKSMLQKKNFLFLNKNICCGYSKEPSQCDGSFVPLKHMLKVIGKKIFTNLHWKFC